MNVKILVKKRELLFFTAYIIWTAWYVLTQSSLYGYVIFGGVSKKFIQVACIIILLYKIVYCDKYKVKEIRLLSLISLITLISVIISKENTIGIILILIIASKNISFEKIVKVSLAELSILILFILFSCKIGILENYVYFRADGTARNSLGFKITLFLGAYYLNIVLMYLYLRNEKVRYFEYIFILTLNLIIYRLTNNRSVYFLIYFSVFLSIVLVKIKLPNKLNWVFNQMFSYCIPFCSVVSITLSLLYDDSKTWTVFLNKALTNRLMLGKEAYLNYGFHMFGNNITMVGAAGTEFYTGNVSKSNYNYVDSSYLQIILKCGIIFFIMMCILYTFLCIKEVKKKNIILCICILTIAIQGIINDQFMLPAYNTFLLAFTELFSKPSKIAMINN